MRPVLSKLRGCYVEWDVPALTDASSCIVAAALLFGDIRHTANQPYNTLGGAGIDGVYPRSDELLKGLNSFASVLRDWCEEGDPVCAFGGGRKTYNVQMHLNYFNRYSGDAADWVKSSM